MSAVTAESLRRRDQPADAPAQSDAAEQALLASLIQSNIAFDRVSQIVKPEHFASRIHGRMFEACGLMLDRGQSVDQITLRQYFEGDPDLEEVGGFGYIMSLSRSMCSILNVADYAQAIRDCWLQRETVRIAEEMLAVVRRPSYETPLAEQLRPFSEELERLNVESEPASGLRPLSKLTGLYLDRLNEAKRFDAGEVLGIPTGIPPLDAHIGGLPRGKLVVLAGATSMGKSLSAKNIAKAAARSVFDPGDGTPPRPLNVAYFSLEEDIETLQASWAASETGIPAVKHFRAGISDAEFEQLVQWGNTAGQMNIWVDDSANLTAQEIGQRCRVLARRVPVDLVIADYLQLFRLAGRNAADRSSELGDAVFHLRGVARQLNSAMLLLSQVNDENENREGKRPELRDFAQSRVIPKHADIVLFVFREHYYLSKQTIEKGPREAVTDYLDRKREHEDKLENSRNKVDYIVAKFRGGPTGTVTGWADLATNQIESLDKHQGRLWEQN